ncbi:MAG: TerC family protein [Bacteroidia bacterium]|nr:TerC family protein [Bacteroidia bacterium]
MGIVIWGGFIVLILLLLMLDLGVLNRESHVLSTREALFRTGIWVGVALIFNVFVYFAYEYHLFGIGETIGLAMSGREAAAVFFTGYLIEESLSVDNIFVIAIIFSYFKVPAQYQHRVLFWGILGAIVFRGIMIVIGTALIENVSWITYVFGGLLIYSAVNILLNREEDIEPTKNPAFRIVKFFIPVAPEYDGDRFFTRINGVRAATPIFVVLMIIESTDIMFALDSIPAIFAVTTDPFIVFSSNIFAILGLRSMYFVLASSLDKFRYLKTSLVFVLAFVGIKMLLLHHYKIDTSISMSVILGILGVGVVASLLANRRDLQRQAHTPGPDLAEPEAQAEPSDTPA